MKEGPTHPVMQCALYQHLSYPEETSSELRQALSEINLMLLLFDMPPRAPVVAAVSKEWKSLLVRPELRFFSCDFTTVSTTSWEERAPWFALLVCGCCWPVELSFSQPTSSCPSTFPVLSPSPPGMMGGCCWTALHSEFYEFCHFAKKATVVKGKEHKRSCLSPPPLQFLPYFAQFIFEKTFALGMTLVWVCCLSTGGDFTADDSELARAGQALCRPLFLILCGSFRQNP